MANVFAREGEYWTVAYEGRVTRLRDSKGLRCLAHLLERPGREVHALELATEGARHGDLAALGDAGEAIDATARKQYKRRLQELEEDLEEAEAFHDVERVARARQEIDDLVHELGRGVGLGGRSRTVGSAAERARLSVTKAIRSAIDRLGDADPGLGDHLRATVRTGTFCSYTPDPRAAVEWRREGGPPPASGGPAVVSARPARYVGRERERGLLRGMLDGARDGRGGLVVVGGEPGLGKSRLAEEAGEDARRLGFHVVTGRCYEMQGTPPYIAFVEVIEALARAWPPADVRQLLGDEAAEVAKLVPRFSVRFPDIPAPLPLPPDQERRYLLNSLCDVLGRAAAATPHLVVLEDLHWADEPTLSLLEHLAPRLAETPMVVIATYRDVELEAGGRLARTLETLIRRRLARHVLLAPLTVSEVTALLASLAGGEVPVPLSRLIHAETDGNPFFVEEVFAHLVEEGKLAEAGPGRSAEPRLDELDVPDNVRLVIERRLERLSEGCRRALGVAAVAGRRFGHGVVAAAAGLPVGEVLDVLEEAERARLVVSVADGVEPGFAFAHELIRQTLLLGLSAPRRSLLHARIAGAIEDLHADALDEHAAALAHHMAEAGAHGDASKSVRYLVAAGDRALATTAHEEARRHFQEALDRLPEGLALERADVLVKLGLALRSLGRNDDALAAWYQALDVYEANGKAEAVGRLCWEMGWQLGLSVRLPEAVEVSRRGLAALGDRPGPDRARLLASAGTAQALTGAHGDARRALDEALQLAGRLQDDRVLGEVLTAESILGFVRMRFRDAADAALRAADLLRRAGALWELAQALSMLPHTLLYAGRTDVLVGVLAEAEPLAERLGHLAGVTWARRARAALELLGTGDLDRFSAFAAADLDLCGGAGMRWASDSYTFLGLADFWRGRWGSAAAHLEEAARREITAPYKGRNAAYLLLLRAYAGHEPAARALLESAELPAPGGGGGLGPWTMLLVAVEALTVIGATDEAAGLYPSVLEAMGTGVVLRFLDVRLVDTLAGVAAAAAGSWDAAVPHFEQALRRADEMPDAIEQADARRLYAQMLVRRSGPGDRPRARELLTGATERYRRLSMPEHERLATTMLRDL
jgi:tetratricopeptide (TPR) repeat protein